MPPDAKDAGYLLDMLEHARGVMRAVRGRSVAEYLEVRAEIIWRVATGSIPDLIAALEPLIPPFPAVR